MHDFSAELLYRQCPDYVVTLGVNLKREFFIGAVIAIEGLCPSN